AARRLQSGVFGSDSSSNEPECCAMPTMIEPAVETATARRAGRAADDVLALIVDTPLVDVSVLSPNPRARILAKLEGQNPFGSVKDRIALRMIVDAERSGRLRPGQRIIEPSSGNTGIALSAIAAIKGYPITIVMPANVS